VEEVDGEGKVRDEFGSSDEGDHGDGSVELLATICVGREEKLTCIVLRLATAQTP
jgi:hypothetical protein